MGLELEIGNVICRLFNFFRVDFPVREVAFAISALHGVFFRTFVKNQILEIFPIG